MKRILSIAVLSILGGLMAHVGIFFLIRIETPRAMPASIDSARFDYVGDLGVRSDPVLRQQAQLFDSSPLFMPTRWNGVSQMSDVASLREATEVFGLYPPRLSLPDSPPSLERISPEMELPGSPILPKGPAFILSRLGRQATEQPEVLNSAPSIRAFRLDSPQSRLVQREGFPESIRDQVPQALWTPTQFYLQVVNGKALGVPTLAQSSGFSEWDQALQEFIGSLTFYSLLESGYYRIIVYP